MASNDPYPDCFYNFERHVSEDECVDFVLPLTNVSADRVRTYYREVVDDEPFRNDLKAALDRTDARPTELVPNWRDVLYALVRATRPDTVVETGVYDGLSASYMLRALAKNDHGTLISIDIEDTEILPSDIPDVEPGWLVPDSLRTRWDLHLGDARNLLPAVVAETTIDIFLHDSNHDTDHMAFEFETAADGMEPGSILLADNVEYNDAFETFAADHLTAVQTFVNAEKSLQREGGVVENDKLGAGVIE